MAKRKGGRKIPKVKEIMEDTFIEDAEEFAKRSITYLEVLEHRKTCDKWGKEFCLQCFGGGLTRFTKKLEEEHYRIKKLNQRGNKA